MVKHKIYLVSHSLVYHLPEYMTKEQAATAKEVEVETLPAKEGFDSVLQWNYTEGTAGYVYVEKEKTEIELLKEENQKLKASQAEQDALIMQLMIGGV